MIFCRSGIPDFGVSTAIYVFPHTFSVEGASRTLDPSMGAANCNIKLTNKFISMVI